MLVLIVGTGYLGRVAADLCITKGIKVVSTYNTKKFFPESLQFDLFTQDLDNVLSLETVDAVVLTSKIETNPDTKQVLKAMENVFNICKEKRIIYISTDAVFDGKKGLYKETDDTSPVTPYGVNKKLCEDLLKKKVPNYCIIRPSYIYGYSLGQLDSRLDGAIKMIQSNQEVKKFTDMYKSPTEVNQLAKVILIALTSKFVGTLHGPGNRMSVYDFIKSGLTVLGYPTDKIKKDHIPANPPIDCLPDTSLDCTYLEKLFNIKPIAIAEALRK